MDSRLGTAERISGMAKELFINERAQTRLDGWFLVKEAQMFAEPLLSHLPSIERAAALDRIAVEILPLSIPESAVFAGTQRDAFARSYALINPSFTVESFNGYCDPTAVYGDIEPNSDITQERIDAVRAYYKDSEYVRALSDVYEECEAETCEVAYFVEQVTGHVIPDVRPILREGALSRIALLDRNIANETDPLKLSGFRAMKSSLETLLLLTERYRTLAVNLAAQATGERKAQLELIAQTLTRVPAYGAETLYQAIQSFMLIWQLMTLEQAPNPFAFSVGNADRIFEPYRAKEELSCEEAAALLKHLLVFFNVGDRSWAISQNLIISGRDANGRDLTNETSYALLDAYYDMNLPQPILSVKVSRNTPESLHRALGKFWFTPGMLTPSLFGDEAVFETLQLAGVEDADLPNYSIAGCQEPLIMGQDNGNTTNSWLNLAKILELTLNYGQSTLTGRTIGTCVEPAEPIEALRNIRERFYQNLNMFLKHMRIAANGATKAVSYLPVPFLSAMMGGIDTGYDMRDVEHQGTKYNGSGCLIHGIGVVADSFAAIDELLRKRPQNSAKLLDALRNNFKGEEALRQYLLTCPKYGNNLNGVDAEAVELTSRVADAVRELRNDLGNPFRPDFSTPSTHLLYGYWVGALPNGRPARDMLSYGIDPLYGDAANGLGFRTLSTMKLPFEKMCGGYASHLGIDPKYFRAASLEDKGIEFRDRVINPLFFNPAGKGVQPFYLYVNVTTPEILRKVLANPQKYAPNGVYIMRIHGTFVNFLDLAPSIQQDIIRRLDPASTAMEA
ncbi:dehydrogenase [Clostridia bacterium]|nr:dehydrogenase [Clostridia bacterium]